jgi:hypothetical protein
MTVGWEEETNKVDIPGSGQSRDKMTIPILLPLVFLLLGTLFIFNR